MNAFLFLERALERASIIGLAALSVALLAQYGLENRVPAAWRVWIWRVALLQTAFALVPLLPLRLAVLPPRRIAQSARVAAKSPVETPLRAAENRVSPAVAAKTSAASALRDFDSAPRETPSASRRFWSQQGVSSLRPQSLVPSKLTPKAKKFIAPRGFYLFALSVYALGWALHLGTLARSWWRVRRLLRACTSLEDAETELALMRGARRIGAAPPRLLVQSEGAPFLVGVVAPAVVLPRQLLVARGADLDAVIHHELAHLKRRDLVWNLVLWPIQAMFWFHPLVWAARHFLPLETESACDEMVLASTQITPRTYGALLLNTMNCEPNLLTAGVSDGFAAFKTRLKRLNYTPKTPRPAARIAFGAALLCALLALVPLRLETRAAAQVEAASPSVSVPKSAPNDAGTPSTSLQGTVRDRGGKPVAGATVYAMNGAQNGNEPLEIVTSDARGHFLFSAKVRVKGDDFSVFADAGKRGLGDVAVYADAKGSIGSMRPVAIRVRSTVRATLRFLDPQGHPVVGLATHIFGLTEVVSRPLPAVSAKKSSTLPEGLAESLKRPLYRWKERLIIVPRPLLARFEAKTDAHGEANFPALLRGFDARFWAGDQKPASAWGDPILFRGARFAPLRFDSVLDLYPPQVKRTVRLVAATGLFGHISFPDGNMAENAVVSAQLLEGPNGASFRERGTVLKMQVIADDGANYRLEGLRPGRYLIQVYPPRNWARGFVGPTSEMIIGPTQRADFRLMVKPRRNS